MRWPLQSKLVGERITVHFNFLDVVTIPETIAEHEVTVQVDSGEDAEPQALLFEAGEHDAVDGEVSQQIHLGVPGVIYWLTCRMVSDRGFTYIKKMRLAILPSPLVIPDLLGQLYTTEIYPIEHRAFVQHSLYQMEGRLYPTPFPVEAVQHAMAMLGGDVASALKAFTATTEMVQHSFEDLSGTLEVKLLFYEMLPDEVQHSINFLNGELAVKLISYTPPPDEVQHSMSFTSGSLT